MDLEERMWLNQNIFGHKDVQYNTGNSLGLSFSSSTQDFQSYSAPNLNLSISGSNVHKNFTINYQTAIELTKAFKEGSSSNFVSFSVYRKQGDRSLKIEVRHFQDTKELIALIIISYSSSDSVVIVLPMSVFFSLMCLIKDFSIYFLNLTFDFTTRSLVTELLKETKLVNTSIKSLPSFLRDIPNWSKTQTNGLSKEEQQVVPETIDSSLTNDLSKFMEQNIDKIQIPELGKSEVKHELGEVSQDHNSPFIYKVLKGEISVLENLVNAASVKMGNSILTFKDILIRDMGIEGVEYLPGITTNELKAALCMTKVFFGTTLFSFVNKNAKAPKSIPVIKYKVPEVSLKDVTNVNIDLAYDLLLISGYLRLMKNQLEEKLQDEVASKAFLYLSVRCFTDIFTFSVLEDLNPATIKSCVLSRFKSYQKSKVFRKYEYIMETYSCKQITETDISMFLDEVCTKIIKKSMYIKDLYEKNYTDGFFNISFENPFSIEQIINEVAILEIAKRVGIDHTNDADLSRLADPSTISEEIKESFAKKPKTTPKKVEEKESNIVRFARLYKEEVPEKFRDKFLNYLKELKQGPCVLDNQDFPLEELGDDIVKGLYIWNETDRNEKYTDFFIKYETCLLDKKLIVSKARSGNVMNTKQIAEDWVGGSIEVD